MQKSNLHHADKDVGDDVSVGTCTFYDNLVVGISEAIAEVEGGEIRSKLEAEF